MKFAAKNVYLCPCNGKNSAWSNLFPLASSVDSSVRSITSWISSASKKVRKIKNYYKNQSISLLFEFTVFLYWTIGYNCFSARRYDFLGHLNENRIYQNTMFSWRTLYFSYHSEKFFIVQLRSNILFIFWYGSKSDCFLLQNDSFIKQIKNLKKLQQNLNKLFWCSWKG